MPTTAAHKPKPANETETANHCQMLRRMIQSLIPRIAEGDTITLATANDLATDLNHAIAEGARQLNAEGYSWADIGHAVGTTRQAAYQRWGRLCIHCFANLPRHLADCPSADK